MIKTSEIHVGDIIGHQIEGDPVDGYALVLSRALPRETWWEVYWLSGSTKFRRGLVGFAVPKYWFKV